MKQLLEQVEANSTYVEIPDRGHVFPGMMATDQLSAFYREHLSARTVPPRRPDNFTLTVARPFDTASKHGVRVWELLLPGQIGKVEVWTNNLSGACHVRTSNIRTLTLPWTPDHCSSTMADGQDITNMVHSSPQGSLRNNQGHWAIASTSDTDAGGTRDSATKTTHRQLGGLDAIMRTHGKFRIVAKGGHAADFVALQLSRNLLQYYFADAHIDVVDEEEEDDRDPTSNVIRVIEAPQLHLPTAGAAHQTASKDTRPAVFVTDHEGVKHDYRSQGGLAAVYVHPRPSGHTEIVIWGSDEIGLDIAARLAPMLTGVGQPDFIVADKTMLWKGAGGVLCMGFFDIYTQPSRNSYFT